MFFTACQTETKQASPEQVVEQYAQLLHLGEIEQAKSLCTPAANAYLDALSAVIEAAETGLDSSESKIEAIRCVQSEDLLSAQCEGSFDDGFERYTEAFLLSFVNDQWLIDHQPDSGTLHSTEEVLTDEEELDE